DERWPAHRAAGDWWRRTRWLVLPVALPLFLVFGLALGTLVNLGLSGGAGRSPAGTAVAAETAAPAVCQRIEHIVGTACGLKQRDRDAYGIRHCVAQELKYTLWSAYGCQ